MHTGNDANLVILTLNTPSTQVMVHLAIQYCQLLQVMVSKWLVWFNHGGPTLWLGLSCRIYVYANSICIACYYIYFVHIYGMKIMIGSFIQEVDAPLTGNTPPNYSTPAILGHGKSTVWFAYIWMPLINNYSLISTLHLFEWPFKSVVQVPPQMESVRPCQAPVSDMLCTYLLIPWYCITNLDPHVPQTSRQINMVLQATQYLELVLKPPFRKSVRASLWHYYYCTYVTTFNVDLFNLIESRPKHLYTPHIILLYYEQ